MIMNKYIEHIYVIPEDDADRQIAVGFVGHHRVRDIRIKVMPVAGGWSNVLKTFKDEYVQRLRDNSKAHVVMLIDFDGHFDERRAKFENEIPDEIKPRVFVVGSKNTPETLKNALNKNFERIGESLADDCDAGTTEHWGHEQLTHNDPDRRRLDQLVKPFLF
jgi:hypothetical protein